MANKQKAKKATPILILLIIECAHATTAGTQRPKDDAVEPVCFLHLIWLPGIELTPSDLPSQ